MTKLRRAPKRCTVCGAQCGVYLCPRCCGELRALLIGVPSGVRGQPGIAWYVDRLYEQAFLQSRLDRQLARVSTSRGYALLVDRDAIALLGRIRDLLGAWKRVVTGLSATQTAKNGQVGVRTLEGHSETVTACYLAANIDALGRYCAHVHLLHQDLTVYARKSWVVINRPPDSFCGPCPAIREDGDECGTLLYAYDGGATMVRCGKCRSEHDMESLRRRLRDVAKDMLFTAAEIRCLMTTRLGDPMSDATFHRLRRDGRLLARGFNQQGEEMFTYADICAARSKARPVHRKQRAESDDSAGMTQETADQHG